MIRIWFALVVFGFGVSGSIPTYASRPPIRCEIELTATEINTENGERAPLDAHGAEERLQALVEWGESLEATPMWTSIIQKYLLPALRTPTQKLVLTLVGPANVGKSQVFNAVGNMHSEEGAPLTAVTPSLVSFDAESTARSVLMFKASQASEHGIFDSRFIRTERWRGERQSAESGLPLLVPVDRFYENLILVDTPAFNTAAFQEVVNESIQLSDILIYNFSNATYNDDSDLSYLRSALANYGPKDLIFVYNVNAAISDDIIKRHVESVAFKLFPSFKQRGELPSNIIGIYHMVHSDKIAKGQAPLEMIPFGDSPPFKDLLGGLDQNAKTHRRQSLNLSLQYVLEGVEESIHNSDRERAEAQLVEDVFKAYLNILVTDAIKHIPYHRLGSELEDIWSRQSTGLRGFAHWLARPLKMSGMLNRNPTSPAKREIERYLEISIDDIISHFRLAVAEGVIRLSRSDEATASALASVETYRKKFKLGPNEFPRVRERNDNYEIHLAGSPLIANYFNRYLRRDWDTVIPDAKQDILGNLANLTLEVYSRLDVLAREQPLTVRAQQSLYTMLAILPSVAAISYIAYRGGTLLDVPSLASLFAAHLAARLFVSLDEQSLRRGWHQSVRDWFEQRQKPHLLEVLSRHTGLRPVGTLEKSDHQGIMNAIRDLEYSGIPLE